MILVTVSACKAHARSICCLGRWSFPGHVAGLPIYDQKGRLAPWATAVGPTTTHMHLFTTRESS